VQDSLELYRGCDDPRGIASCLCHLAWAETWVGHHDHSRALCEQAVRHAQRARDEPAIALARARAAVSGADYEDVSRRAHQAMPYLHRVGNLEEVARLCVTAAYVAIAEDRYQDALPWLDEALDAARPLDEPEWLFAIEGNRGLASLFLDRLDAARDQFCDALAVCREAGSEDVADETLLGLAAVEASYGQWTRAARLMGAAKEHQARRMVDEQIVWSRLIDDILCPARDRYGPERWDHAEREGTTLTVHEAIDLALERGRFARQATTTTASTPN
jgi:tetratricopeptide (TPR) repeat protein